jgi:hypothetical protein
MGVRLYPATKDEAKLEKLAGVPAGTAAKLRDLEAKYPITKEMDFFQVQAVYNGKYGELYAPGNGDLNHYHSFLLFGFGRFAGGKDCDGGSEVGGSTTDTAKVEALLRLHGVQVTMAEVEGLYWG